MIIGIKMKLRSGYSGKQNPDIDRGVTTSERSVVCDVSRALLHPMPFPPRRFPPRFIAVSSSLSSVSRPSLNRGSRSPQCRERESNTWFRPPTAPPSPSTTSTSKRPTTPRAHPSPPRHRQPQTRLPPPYGGGLRPSTVLQSSRYTAQSP